MTGKRIFFVFLLYMFLTIIPGAGKVYASEFVNPAPSRIAEVTGWRIAGLPVTEDEATAVSAPALSQPVETVNGTGYILIGDSRAVGIDVQCKVNQTPDSFFVVAAAGQGYYYMMSLALPVAQQIKQAHPEIAHWKYIINLGVNDTENAGSYAAALAVLATVKDVSIVSVNPVVDNAFLAREGYTNERIVQFNNVMRTVPGTKYIDTFTTLIINGFETTAEGLHYTGKTTETIYNMIRANVY